MGLKVGDITSKHVIIPPLYEVVQACNDYIQEIEKSIDNNFKVIIRNIDKLNSENLKYIVLKE
jgi:hypothetical protein